MELSKFQTKKTKFGINFLTFKMAKVQIFAMFSMQKILETVCKSFNN